MFPGRKIHDHDYPSRPEGQPTCWIYLCPAHARTHARSLANIDRQTDGEQDPARTLFAVGELLEPDGEFTVVYIESKRGSSHVSRREKRGEPLPIHTWTPGERRGKYLAELRETPRVCSLCGSTSADSQNIRGKKGEDEGNFSHHPNLERPDYLATCGLATSQRFTRQGVLRVAWNIPRENFSEGDSRKVDPRVSRQREEARVPSTGSKQECKRKSYNEANGGGGQRETRHAPPTRPR